jgi:A/G-specific adenine glycosylase
VDSLARAESDRVLELWEGLGYYSRARNLLVAARQVVLRFEGRIPRSAEDFGSLPGVGPYTTAAVLSIAFDLDLAVIDGNVRRVLSRLIALDQDPRQRSASHLLEALATELIPKGEAGLHNQALMELGALVCTPRSPRCAGCPLARPCRARITGEQESFPRRRRRKPIPHRRYEVGLVLDAEGALLIEQRPYEGFLGGLWELPKVASQPGERPGARLSRRLEHEFGLEVRKQRRQAIAPVSHAYSHFRVTLTPLVYHLTRIVTRAAEESSARWTDPSDLPAMSRADRKVLEQWRSSG